MIKAVILAGGLGTRLKPLTEETPKVMLRIQGMPFLHYVVADLRKSGICDFVIACSYHWTQIKTFFQTGLNYHARIKYSIEAQPLGSAHALRVAYNKLGADIPVVVVNGDTLLQGMDYEKLLLEFGQSGKDICRVMAPNPLANGKYAFSGVSIISPHVLEAIARSEANSLEKDYFPKFSCFDREIPGYYFDIGTPEGLALTGMVLSGKKAQDAIKEIKAMDEAKEGKDTADRGKGVPAQ